jgi:phosphoribosylformylglycinamidine synthase
MYIDGNLLGPFGERRRVSGLPTLLFTVCSVIDDVEMCVSMDAKLPGDLVYVVGNTRDELGGGEYYQMLGFTGLNVPRVDAEPFFRAYESLSKAIAEGIVSSCHAVSRGGLGVHLAMVAMAGELGMQVDLSLLPGEKDLPASKRLFSESAGRFIVTIAPDAKESFEKTMEGSSYGRIGRCDPSGKLTVTDVTGILMSEDIMSLKECWKRPFGGLV